MSSPKILTHYANETIEKHTTEIPQYVIDQLQIVINANNEIEVITREKRRLTANHQKLTDRKKVIMNQIYNNLKIPFAIAQSGGEEIKRRYFPDTPSIVLHSGGEMMLDLLENINDRIEDDPDTPLIAYKEQMIADFNELKTILIACYDTRGNGQVATAKKQAAVRKWHVEYIRLKGLLKYALFGGDLNYKIFFKDLTLTASKPETEEDLAALELETIEEEIPALKESE